MKRLLCVLAPLLLQVLAAAPPALAAGDGIALTVARGTTPGDVALGWTGAPAGPCTVYRSTKYSPNAGIGNALATTSAASWMDRPPSGSIFFYEITVAPFWTRDISASPADTASSSVIANLSTAGGFGNGRLQIDFSIKALNADAHTPFRTFHATSDFYSPDCDQVPVPVPAVGSLEGESGYACVHDGDCHLIVYHQPTNKLYEMWRANITATAFDGGCLAVWDVDRTYTAAGRGEQCSSADAAGMPIAPLLFTADELAAGAINHAIRFILPNPRMQQGVYVHPATHAGAPSGSGLPPYGARLRLRADYPLASLPDEGTRTIARALQKYGMILADGGNIALTAMSDQYSTAKWSTVLPSGSTGLQAIHVTDFTMIDAGTRISLTYDCVRTP